MNFCQARVPNSRRSERAGAAQANHLRRGDHVIERRDCAVCALWAGMAAFAASAAYAQTPLTAGRATATAQEQFTCRLPGATDRLIGIYRAPLGSQRCRVDYIRDGKTRSLWSAGHDYTYCVRQALKIVGLLEQARFNCTPRTRETPGSVPAG